MKSIRKRLVNCNFLGDAYCIIAKLIGELSVSRSSDQKVDLCCKLILAVFDSFYRELCEYPFRAKKAFEDREPQKLIKISEERLNLYSKYVAELAPKLREAYRELQESEALWDSLDTKFNELISYRYEADIAYSFANSIRRRIFQDEWKPVAYSFSTPTNKRADALARVYKRLQLNGSVEKHHVLKLMSAPDFSVAYRALESDAIRVCQRLNQLIKQGDYGDQTMLAIDVIKAGFFRDMTAFIVARFVTAGGEYKPVILAVLNSEEGIYIDAVLYKMSDAHDLFSSTLANFHVTNKLYYQTCVFLYSIMPCRPLGLHYSTIGFNHVGKVVVMNELKDELRKANAVLSSSPGFEGTVAIGFTFEECSYHLKVIRNKPTKAYKWGEFQGVDAVLGKYYLIHQVNRTGSMLDSIIYRNLRMESSMFEPNLLRNILDQASDSVSLHGDYVLFKTLIVQLKITPFPVYVEIADSQQKRKASRNLGYCIKNNMAANIFNHDLDSRNYGVGQFGKVFLFDYDALEKLTDVKVRTNLDRFDGEEDIPDWFFEDGVVFLPEELESGLQIRNREARFYFHEAHEDLLRVDSWESTQQKLINGEVIGLKTYADARKI